MGVNILEELGHIYGNIFLEMFDFEESMIGSHLLSFYFYFPHLLRDVH